MSILSSQNLKAPIPQMTDNELRFFPGENLTQEQEFEVAMEMLRRIRACPDCTVFFSMAD